MINSSLGERLKSERKRLKLTQAEAAEIACVARETWGRYESGKLQPGSSVLAAFSAKGADTGYILGGQEGVLVDAIIKGNEYARKLFEESGLIIQEPRANYKNRHDQLLANFEKLDESGKSAVEAMIEALLNKK